MQKYFFQYFMTALGCTLMSIAINAFYVPQHLLSGGISGVSIILYYVFNLSIGLTSILINIPLFVLAYRYMDKNYFLNSAFGVAVFSITIEATHFLSLAPFTHDRLLSCLAGGVLHGISCACLYRVGGSSGGTDIIGAIVNKYYSISIGTIVFLLNILLMAFAAYLFGLEPALYTLCAFFASFKVSNAFTDGFDYKRSFYIISDKHEEIAAAIIDVVGRGVTYLHAEGAYTKQDRQVIFAVVKLTQVAQIKSLLKRIDPKAFVIIQDVTDVFGKGFTLQGDRPKNKPSKFPKYK